MIEMQGDVFTSTANYIGHGVNCQGMMGAGIAAEFRSRYPINYQTYVKACFDGSLTPGGFLVVPEPDQDAPHNMRLVTNFASQNLPGADASCRWLNESLTAFARQASSPNRLSTYGGRVAIPKIGCGIGGLDIDDVVNIISSVELSYPGIEFELYL